MLSQINQNQEKNTDKNLSKYMKNLINPPKDIVQLTKMMLKLNSQLQTEKCVVDQTVILPTYFPSLSMIHKEVVSDSISELISEKEPLFGSMMNFIHPHLKTCGGLTIGTLMLVSTSIKNSKLVKMLLMSMVLKIVVMDLWTSDSKKILMDGAVLTISVMPYQMIHHQPQLQAQLTHQLTQLTQTTEVDYKEETQYVKKLHSTLNVVMKETLMLLVMTKIVSIGYQNLSVSLLDLPSFYMTYVISKEKMLNSTNPLLVLKTLNIL